MVEEDVIVGSTARLKAIYRNPDTHRAEQVPEPVRILVRLPDNSEVTLDADLLEDAGSGRVGDFPCYVANFVTSQVGVHLGRGFSSGDPIFAEGYFTVRESILGP